MFIFLQRETYENIKSDIKVGLFSSCFIFNSDIDILKTIISLATLLAITMATLILGDSIIKYLQKDFVHKNVQVKAFPGYNISMLHARLDTDVVSS